MSIHVVCVQSCLQIEQDFSLLFGDDISAKFLEKWPTFYKQKVIEQSRGITQTADVQDLLENAESTEELETGNALMEDVIVFEKQPNSF